MNGKGRLVEEEKSPNTRKGKIAGRQLEKATNFVRNCMGLLQQYPCTIPKNDAYELAAHVRR
jgi:hypothetical protein